MKHYMTFATVAIGKSSPETWKIRVFYGNQMMGMTFISSWPLHNLISLFRAFYIEARTFVTFKFEIRSEGYGNSRAYVWADGFPKFFAIYR